MIIVTETLLWTGKNFKAQLPLSIVKDKIIQTWIELTPGNIALMYVCIPFISQMTFINKK